MYFIAQSVVSEIARTIGSVRPEQGGALLGPPQKPVITRFVFDRSAKVSGASYSPSRWLSREVQRLERDAKVELKGIVHSHPGSMDHPSGQDEYELNVGLELNPHLRAYAAPIVTLHRRETALGAHEIPLGSGKLSLFVAYRRVSEEGEGGNDG